VTAREIIRVEPLSTYLERWKAPTLAVTRAGGTVYVSGFPPFDPARPRLRHVPAWPGPFDIEIDCVATI
jgi:2-iminobutanoate/2-iminopropanoate deaminase